MMAAEKFRAVHYVRAAAAFLHLLDYDACVVEDLSNHLCDRSALAIAGSGHPSFQLSSALGHRQASGEQTNRSDRQAGTAEASSLANPKVVLGHQPLDGLIISVPTQLSHEEAEFE
jgi:hypothetical protein